MAAMTTPSLAVELAPSAKRNLPLANPVMVASGTFGYGVEYAQVFDVQRLGAIVTKTTTLAPRRGNLPPRIAETPSGMLNSIGLQNIGVAALIRDMAPVYAAWRVPVIASILGSTVGEYAEVASQVEARQVRVINSFTKERIPRSSIPTATEQGVSIVVEKFRGLLGPKGMEPGAVTYWEQAAKRALDRPAYKQYYESVYLVPGYMDHVQYRLYLDRMNQTLRRYMKEIGVLK